MREPLTEFSDGVGAGDPAPCDHSGADPGRYVVKRAVTMPAVGEGCELVLLGRSQADAEGHAADVARGCRAWTGCFAGSRSSTPASTTRSTLTSNPLRCSHRGYRSGSQRRRLNAGRSSARRNGTVLARRLRSSGGCLDPRVPLSGTELDRGLPTAPSSHLPIAAARPLSRLEAPVVGAP